MNEVPIRILLVGEAKDACRLRGLLGAEGSSQFHIAHVPDLDLAADRLSSESAEILLLDLGDRQRQGRSFVQAARAAAPETPMVILAETHDGVLGIEALRLGVQDFLAKEGLDGSSLARALRYAMERHRLQKNLQNLSLIDDLTSLYNRRGFLALAEQHLRMIQRKGAALLIYVDLDDLKMINDSYGHLKGNRALIVTANVLRACFRQSDILARLGGDEFCVLMIDAGQDSALQVRRRLQHRQDFHQRAVLVEFPPVPQRRDRRRAGGSPAAPRPIAAHRRCADVRGEAQEAIAHGRFAGAEDVRVCRLFLVSGPGFDRLRKKLQTLSSRTHSRPREWMRDPLFHAGAAFSPPSFQRAGLDETPQAALHNCSG
jgi:diguanylate cyclase (GGDEF)-like protein